MKVMRAMIVVSIAIVLSMTCLYARAAQVSDVQRLYGQFSSMQMLTSWYRSPNGVGAGADEAYVKMFAPFQMAGRLDKMSTPDLQSLFEAAYITAFYTHNVKYADAMRADYLALRNANAVTGLDDSRMFNILIELRLFDQAQTFLNTHSDVESTAVPILHDMRRGNREGPAVLEVTADTATLNLRPANLNKNVQIVVVGHPLCHFTQYAGHDIEASPRLRKIMRSHAIWIAPQDGDLDIADFQNWNADHPDLPIAIVWKQSQWPSINYWGTPTFYFFKHGVLVDKVTGWASDNSTKDKTALIAALAEVGLVRQ